MRTRVNSITRLEFEPIYYNVAVKHVSHYAMRTSPTRIQNEYFIPYNCRRTNNYGQRKKVYWKYSYDYKKKKLEGNYTRMLRAILNKSCGNTPQGTNYTANWLPSRKLYKLEEPDTQDTAGEARTNSSVMYSYGPAHMAKQKQDDQLEYAYSSYVRIRDEALKTCQKRWMTGRSGERGSGISVLAARHHDDDDDDNQISTNE